MNEIRKAFAEMLPIIKAYSEGKEIEFFDNNDNKWVILDIPSWNPEGKYRVKPESEIYYTRVFDDYETGSMAKTKDFRGLEGGDFCLIGHYKTTVIDGTIVDVCFEPLEEE